MRWRITWEDDPLWRQETEFSYFLFGGQRRQGQEHLTAGEGMLSPWLLYAQMHALLPAKQQQQSPLVIALT